MVVVAGSFSGVVTLLCPDDGVVFNFGSDANVDSYLRIVSGWSCPV